jgi:hypothetical protein
MAPIPKRIALTLVLGCLLSVGGCSGCGVRAAAGSGSGSASAPIAAASPTATPAPSATATHAPAPTPTKTPVPPTPTPVPPLQGQVVSQSLGTSIGSHTNSSIADVSCPAGYLVAGGGINSGYTTFNIMWNAPISTTTWRGEIFNTGSSPIAAQLQVMCVHVSGLVGQVVSKALGTINPSANSSIVDVSCPAGYLVAGGGISSGYGTLVTMWSAPINTTTWQEEVYNTDTVPALAQVQAECLKISGLVGQVISAAPWNVNGGTNSMIIDTSCPSGYLVAGGGLKSGSTTQTLMQSDPISTTTWQSEIYNTGASLISAQAQIECLKR